MDFMVNNFSIIVRIFLSEVSENSFEIKKLRNKKTDVSDIFSIDTVL